MKSKTVRMYDPNRRDPERIRATRRRMNDSRIHTIIFFIMAAVMLAFTSYFFWHHRPIMVLISLVFCLWDIDRAVHYMTEHTNCKGQLMIDELIDRQDPD